MPFHPCSLSRQRPRAGKTLILFLILLPVLLGITGLVVDGGLLMASYRQTQNAADGAALAGALALLNGKSPSSAVTAYLSGNGMNLAQAATVNNPPQSGNYANPPSPLNKNNYVEVSLTNNVNVFFIALIPGIGNVQTVTARAVAGFEQISVGEGVGVLDPQPKNGQGLTVTGSGTVLKVNGKIIVNSEGKGFSWGNSATTNGTAIQIGSYTQGPAAKTSNGAQMDSPNIRIVGGIGNGDQNNFFDYNGQNATKTVHTGQLPTPDPFIRLPTPYKDNDGLDANAQPQSVSVSNNQTVTLNPGIYNSININGGTVTFSPGIYILQPTNGNGNILSITGGTVTGNGVMFYNTGSDYNHGDGTPDINDGSASPNPPNSTNFQGIDIHSATVTLTPISNGGVFDGMLFYQRRWNQAADQISGASGNLSLGGTLYAKWAPFNLAGQGTYQGQFIVGSMSVSGGAAVTIKFAGNKVGVTSQVFLVE